MLHLDGSHGEGGGKILRTALSLAANQEQPVRIDNIRDKKSMPWVPKGEGVNV